LINDREKKAKRIAAVRKELHRLAEWKLHDGLHMDAVLKNKQNELLSFLEKDAAFTGRFAVTAMQRLRDVAEIRAHLVSEQETHARQALEEGRLLRLSERILREVKQDLRYDMQRKDLDNAIEVSLISRE
jgi:hypothetical protein